MVFSTTFPAYNYQFSWSTPGYFNFDDRNAGSGTAGYGIRDNSGSPEVKASGGSWATIADTSTSQRLTNKTINLSTVPGSPADGDIWYDGVNFKVRIGGSTKTITVS